MRVIQVVLDLHHGGIEGLVGHVVLEEYGLETAIAPAGPGRFGDQLGGIGPVDGSHAAGLIHLQPPPDPRHPELGCQPERYTQHNQPQHPAQLPLAI
ncbi:hypothetical protein D3C76_1224730 [compost metagenome]